MATYAIIENGKVANVIEADADFVAEQNFEVVLVTDATGVPYHNAMWNGNSFIRPEAPAQPASDSENRVPAEY